MNTAVLTLEQVGYANKIFWRNAASVVFTFALPLIFLVVFTSLLGNHTIPIGPVEVKLSTYYVASMGAFAIMAATYVNLAIGVAIQRERLVLKRFRSTPLPSWAFLGSRVIHGTLVGVALLVITAVFGRLAYGARIPTGVTLGEVVVDVLVGSFAFSALGLAATVIVPNADAAAPVINGTILPIQFLSGVFIAFSNTTPSWIVWIGRIFPVRHFVLGLQAGFVGTPFAWSDVLVVAVWGVAGLLFAVRFFRWEPRT